MLLPHHYLKSLFDPVVAMEVSKRITNSSRSRLSFLMHDDQKRDNKKERHGHDVVWPWGTLLQLLAAYSLSISAGGDLHVFKSCTLHKRSLPLLNLVNGHPKREPDLIVIICFHFTHINELPIVGATVVIYSIRHFTALSIPSTKIFLALLEIRTVPPNHISFGCNLNCNLKHLGTLANNSPF
jgi:hypothetical protein